jgi:multiple sugar transport system permease protein
MSVTPTTASPAAPGSAAVATPAERAGRTRGMSPLARREAIDGYLFIAPWIIGFVLFTAGPMIASFALIFVDWDLLGDPRWGGMTNVTRLFNDRLVGESLYNTAYFTFFSVPLRLSLALAVAILLNQAVRGQSFWRTLFYLPAVVPAVANVILWMWMFSPNQGLFNMVLTSLGLPRLNWLWDPNLAKPSLILMSLWTIGNVVIIFLAGLQSIPDDVYEAAAVDGATRWQRFTRITLPMLVPFITMALILRAIDAFRIFELALVLAGRIEPVLSTYIADRYLPPTNDPFTAAAGAVVLFALIMVFIVAYLRFVARRVETAR